MQALIERSTTQKQITIASGGTVSGPCSAQGLASLFLETPASFEGTTLTFQVSSDGTTFVPLCDDSGGNTAASITVGVSRGYPLPTGLSAWPWFQITSNNATAADRLLKLWGQG